MQGSRSRTRKPGGIVLGNETKAVRAQVLGLTTSCSQGTGRESLGLPRDHFKENNTLIAPASID